MIRLGLWNARTRVALCPVFVVRGSQSAAAYAKPADRLWRRHPHIVFFFALPSPRFGDGRSSVNGRCLTSVVRRTFPAALLAERRRSGSVCLSVDARRCFVRMLSPTAEGSSFNGTTPSDEPRSPWMLVHENDSDGSSALIYCILGQRTTEKHPMSHFTRALAPRARKTYLCPTVKFLSTVEMQSTCLNTVHLRGRHCSDRPGSSRKVRENGIRSWRLTNRTPRGSSFDISVTISLPSACRQRFRKGRRTGHSPRTCDAILSGGQAAFVGKEV